MISRHACSLLVLFALMVAGLFVACGDEATSTTAPSVASGDAQVTGLASARSQGDGDDDSDDPSDDDSSTTAVAMTAVTTTAAEPPVMMATAIVFGDSTSVSKTVQPSPAAWWRYKSKTPW